MPYTKEDIKKLIDINNQVEKSAITSLYASLPSTSELFTGFEQYRNSVLNKDWNYWKNLIGFSLANGFDFIYLLNNPSRMPIEKSDFENTLQKLDNLLNELKSIGVNKLRIAEHKLMGYISKNYPYFDIYASTSFEFKLLAEYKNFVYMHPNIKQIVPSSDCIKNFQLLKNLRITFPQIEIEVMVNEGCVNGCPNRDGHAAEIMDRHIFHNGNINLSNRYFIETFCINLEKQNPFYSIIKANVVYPWEIENYARIGINKFKLVGRDSFDLNTNLYINRYLFYLKGIDNYKEVEDVSIVTFIHHLTGCSELRELKTKDVMNLLPKIEHFKKYGQLCASCCGVECRYCYKCAEKIERVFQKKKREKEKLPKYVSACKMET